MADHFYGVNKGAGANPNDATAGRSAVTNGTSTTSKSIELRLHDGDTLTRQEVLNALKAFENYFMRADTVITA